MNCLLSYFQVENKIIRSIVNVPEIAATILWRAVNNGRCVFNVKNKKGNKLGYCLGRFIEKFNVYTTHDL